MEVVVDVDASARFEVVVDVDALDAMLGDRELIVSCIAGVILKRSFRLGICFTRVGAGADNLGNALDHLSNVFRHRQIKPL